MDELEVFAKICDFLENRFGSGNVGSAHVDLVGRSRNVKVQVECKGTKSDLDRALGQCLRYYVKNKRIPIFLGVPEDYHQLDLLKEIINSIDLPIGLLIVKNNGDIVIGRVPARADRVIEKFRLCKKCGVSLYSIVSPTGKLIGYKCFKCGAEEKVESSIIAQFIDLDF